MADTYSDKLRLILQVNGENDGTWGDRVDTNIGTLLEEAIAGIAAVVFASDANVTLTANSGASDEARCAVLSCTSGVSLTATRDVIVPTKSKLYLVYNNTTGAQSIRVKTSAGTGITIPTGKKQYVYCDGTNVVDAITNLPSGATIGGATPYYAGGTDIALADGGTGASLADPGADGLVGWDDSGGSVIFFTLAGSGISFDGTTVKLSASLEEWSTLNPSANAGSLVTAADYAAMRTLLSVGTAGLLDEMSTAQFWANTADKVLSTDTVWAAADPVTITYGATTTLDFSTFINGKITLTGNVTFANPSNVKKGQSGCIEVIQDATGSRLATWGTNWRFVGGTDIVLSTAANARDLIFYQILDDDTVFVSAAKAVAN